MDVPAPIPGWLDEIGRRVVHAAFQVHSELGPGLLESVYETCLVDELQRAELVCRRQASIPIRYRGRVLDNGFRADIVVADAVIVELKTVEALQPIHQAQLLTYLRLSDYRLGYLINFNAPKLKSGIRRFIV